MVGWCTIFVKMSTSDFTPKEDKCAFHSIQTSSNIAYMSAANEHRVSCLNIVLTGRNLSKCCNWRGWPPPEPCPWARCREGRPRWWAPCKDSLPTTRSPPSRRPEVRKVSYQVTVTNLTIACRPWHAERADAAEKRCLRELQPCGRTQDYKQSSSIVPIVARCGNHTHSLFAWRAL